MLSKLYEYIKDLVSDGLTRLSLGSSGIVMFLGGLDWNMVFMVLGFLIALATFVVNWWYKHKNSKVFAQASLIAAERGYVLREPKE